jgi:N-formylglutamate deformylase
MTAKLPLLVSVPHAGLRVPDEVREHCILSARDIERDSDEGASEVYDFGVAVAGFVTTDVARAVVDLNRAEDDFRPDGVVKTRTCLDVPVHDPFPSPATIELLLERYHRSYHRRLRELAGSGVMLGVDCHTMLAVGPPMGPMAGKRRPEICLSDGDGATCSGAWRRMLTDCLEESFGFEISINAPFKGGHIVRSHARELPWVQLELSRAPFLTNVEKRERVLGALRRFCELARS